MTAPASGYKNRGERVIVTMGIERGAMTEVVENTNPKLSRAFDRWNATLKQLRLENSRTAFISPRLRQKSKIWIDHDLRA
jgi:hypothetical protein